MTPDFGIAKYFVENLIGGELAFQKIDALGRDDEADAIVLQHEALGAQIPQSEQQPLARERHDILHVEQRKRGVIRIRAALAVEQTQYADANLGFSVDSIGELFSEKDGQRPGRIHFELPVILLALHRIAQQSDRPR